MVTKHWQLRVLAPLAALLLGVLLPACGDNTGGGPRPDPPQADCATLDRVDVTGGVEVATEDDLRAALAAGGTVVLTADIDANAPFDIDLPTVFDGGGHTIDAGGRTHLFVSDHTDFTIQNVTLTNARNDVADSVHFSRRSGAAVLAIGRAGDGVGTGSLTVIDVVFTGNEIKSEGPGDLRGGALYGFGMPDITISGSVFTSNVGSNGGAVGGLGSSFRMVSTSFIDNRTNGTGPSGALEGHGGAISLDAVTQNGVTAYLEICGCEFVNNQSQYGGGAIYLVTHWYTGTTVAIDQTVFDSNHSISADEGQGGAIFLMDDDGHSQSSNNRNAASISNSLFVNNETAYRGGALWYWTHEGALTVTNTTFVDNSCFADDTGMGGAAAISRGPADFIHCTFAHNWAKFHGGGLQMGGDTDVGLQSCLFYQNLSDRDSGWANFQTNRPADRDLGGNMQYLSEDQVIDSNSDALVSENAVRADALLEDLADNGGPTMTMLLPLGSPAIDAGATDSAPATDQRGLARDGLPDVGAFEAQ